MPASAALPLPPIETGFLARLNPEQHAAVIAADGPLLVLAGAGTGKTRVLTTRLAHLLLTGRVRPGQVLAVTFTNKAAREMVHRVEELVGRSVQGMWLGTFHAMAVRMLRAHAELVGLKPSFTILDTDDQERLAKQVIQAADLDDKRWPARLLVAIVQRWKDRGWTPAKVPDAEIGDFALGRGVELYRAYQERLVTLNACDFGDLLLHCLTFLGQRADILADYQRRFRAILVDEYQDTNVAQYLWLRLLAQDHRNITCVGDDDQSIYSWRGAEVGNILRFEQDFPGAGVIRLERNYRSTGHILGAASEVIAHNRARHGKTLWTEGEAGLPVRVAGLWDDAEEARYISDEVESWQRAGNKLADTAVLVRASFQTRALEERFIQCGLPYRVIGGPRFYERAEIRDATAYFRLVVQPDDDLAFERVVNLPRRGFGDSSLKVLRRTARGAEISLTAAGLGLVGTDELAGKARSSLRDFLASTARWRSRLADTPPRDMAEMILEESGLTEMWRQDKSADAPGRLDNLKELVKAVSEFETLGGFLEHVALVMENAAEPDADLLSIMTLHGAKGLEFMNVFLAGWEEGLFPSQRALDEGGTKSLEEERRLAYVGMTRARVRLTISFAANRRIYGQWQSSVPSRFVEELPKEHVEHLNRHPATRPDYDAMFDEPVFTAQPSRFRSRRLDPKMIEGKAEILATRPVVKEGTFKSGDRIFHQKFGYGTVDAVDGNKLDIAFEKSGRKKVIDSFVEAT